MLYTLLAALETTPERVVQQFQRSSRNSTRHHCTAKKPLLRTRGAAVGEMPGKACLGDIYGHKFLITVHVMLCALWDAFERVDYEEWVIGLTEITLSQYLWMLRQRSTNLDDTNALVIHRGLSNAYDHEMSTLLAIARGEWLRDESKVPLADVVVALQAHGVVAVKERGVISLEGSARDCVFEPLLARVCVHTTPCHRSCRSYGPTGRSSTRNRRGSTPRPPRCRSTPRSSR